jgi:hypothetical protein
LSLEHNSIENLAKKMKGNKYIFLLIRVKFKLEDKGDTSRRQAIDAFTPEQNDEFYLEEKQYSSLGSKKVVRPIKTDVLQLEQTVDGINLDSRRWLNQTRTSTQQNRQNDPRTCIRLVYLLSIGITTSGFSSLKDSRQLFYNVPRFRRLKITFIFDQL